MAKKMTEREQFYYGKGYVQGKIDFAKDLVKQIQLIEERQDECGYKYECDYAYDSGVDWAVSEALQIINEMIGGSDGRE